MSKVDVVLFDLDGTLLDTLPAIANCFNKTLIEKGYEPFDVVDYKKFVGYGFETVFDRIREIRNIKEQKNDFLNVVRKYYDKEYLKGVKPYENIFELLKYLNENGSVIGVVTNKDHDFAKQNIQSFFKEYSFKYVFGASVDNIYPRKPHPYLIDRICELENLKKEQIVYVGDMLIDYNLSKNAGTKYIHCNYGFELNNVPTEHKVDNSIQIIEILKGYNENKN